MMDRTLNRPSSVGCDTLPITYWWPAARPFSSAELSSIHPSVSDIPAIRN